MKIPTLLIVLAALTLGACKPASAPPTATTSSKPIRIGGLYWPGNYWIDVAHSKGWFKEAGLNVEWVDTNPDFFGSLNDLVTGKLDLVVFSFFDFVHFNAQGKDLVAIFATDYSSGADALVARPGIASMRELAGKKLAIPKGTYLEYLFAMAAQRDGLDATAVTCVDVPAEKAHEELIAGRVDAMFTFEPMAGEGLAKVKGTKLFSTEQAVGINGGFSTIRRQFFQERPADVQALVGVWHRTTEFIKQQPDAAFAIVAAVEKKTPDEVKSFATLDKILDLRENRTAFTYAAGITSLHGSVRQISEFIVERGLAEKKVDSTEVLDDRFLRALEASP